MIVNPNLPAQKGVTIEQVNEAIQAAVPKKVSQLQNDSGFLTQHQNISGKFDKAGGTITGDVRVQSTGKNFGNKINLGDGDFVHFSEPTDDCLEIKAKKINFVTSDTTDQKLTLNGKSLLGSPWSCRTVEKIGVTSFGQLTANRTYANAYLYCKWANYKTLFFQIVATNNDGTKSTAGAIAFPEKENDYFNFAFANQYSSIFAHVSLQFQNNDKIFCSISGETDVNFDIFKEITLEVLAIS